LDHVPTKYTDYYNRLRGYPETICAALDAIATGLSFDVTGRVAYREGSYGSGGSSRIAPIGIAYRNASDDILHKAVVDAIICTHTHPHSIDAAFIQAKAISYLINLSDPSSFNFTAFVHKLMDIARTDALKSTIGKVLNQIEKFSKSGDTALESTSGDDVIGNGIAAVDAIGSALLIFGRFWKTPEIALINAVALGGDTDTIAAHTGALLGALHGSKWIPKRWFDKIENGKRGRDFIIHLAMQLATLDCITCDGRGEKNIKGTGGCYSKGRRVCI